MNRPIGCSSNPGRHRPCRTAARFVITLAMLVYAVAGRAAAAQESDAACASAPEASPQAMSAHERDDTRRFMHGIAAANAGGDRHWVFFSSSGLPPRGPNLDRSWPHDVYVGAWSPVLRRLAEVRVFISRPEAQEPVSVAQNTSGNIFVTFEDGWNASRLLSQRFGVYRADLAPIRPYPNEVESGGHSGHVAAVGQRFVVFYSEGWVQGGGIDNLGTGGGVYVKVYDGSGRFQRRAQVAPHVREWWPMIAGSPRRALLVWQRYLPGEIVARLQYGVFDPETGEFMRTDAVAADLRVRYYTYAAAWVPTVQRFVLVATLASGRTSILLINEAGYVTARLACLPASVREAGIGVDGSTIYVPTHDGRLMTLALTADTIALQGLMRAPFAWGGAGSIGIADGHGAMHFISLSPNGLQEADFSVRGEAAPDAR
ncbi:hypothetical protein ACS0X5_28095 [Burkholderia gladioli]|uniref:hypothetical protein n=1 Tax=Burkholderia gladioli TaxID=28095 RepID=UPI003F7AA6FB